MNKTYKRNKRGQFTRNTLIGTRAFFASKHKSFDGLVIYESQDGSILQVIENTLNGCFDAGYSRQVNIGDGEYSMNFIGSGREVVEMFNANLTRVINSVKPAEMGLGMAKTSLARVQEILEKNLYAQ
jgi:hypothetical protein